MLQSSPPATMPDRGLVLVTGATGFTGGYLTRALLARGYGVRALVRPRTDARPLVDAGVEIAVGDLVVARDVERAAAGVDMIYHIAGLFRTANHGATAYRAVHVKGTRHVVEAAARHRVPRVVHCSTAGVHGAISDVPGREDSPLEPRDMYQLTKLEGEQVAREAFREGLPGVVVRPVGIYGPGDMRFLKLFRSVHQRRFRMFGSGEVPYHLTYIDDLVDGLILCGERPEALGRTYILAGAEYVSLNQLVRMVAEAVGVPVPQGRLPLWPLVAAAALCETVCVPLRIDPPIHLRRVAFFHHPRAFSIRKASQELGFVPRVPVREGVRRTAEWYFEHGHLQGPAPARAVPLEPRSRSHPSYR